MLRTAIVSRHDGGADGGGSGGGIGGGGEGGGGGEMGDCGGEGGEIGGSGGIGGDGGGDVHEPMPLTRIHDATFLRSYLQLIQSRAT